MDQSVLYLPIRKPGEKLPSAIIKFYEKILADLREKTLNELKESLSNFSIDTDFTHNRLPF